MISWLIRYLQITICFSVNKWTKPLIDRNESARMPWHDVSIGFVSKRDQLYKWNPRADILSLWHLQVGKPALDVARHFIERWNFIKKEKAENIPDYPVLIAKSDAQHAREHAKEYPTGLETYEYFGKKYSLHPEQGTAKVQVLRSSSKWSHGIETEVTGRGMFTIGSSYCTYSHARFFQHSIMNAYIQLIREAKHFIYIENQFFCTATKANNSFAVKNLLGKVRLHFIHV